MACTKIFFNPDCAEADELKKRFMENNDSPTMALSQLADTPKISMEDDFLFMTQKKTIEALKDCKEDGCCVVLGTVKHVLEGDEWWYTACTCNKAVYPDSKMFFCEKCNKHVLNVVPRYRIKLRVIDDSDSATFVVFDRDASTLFNKTCSEMVDSVGKSHGAYGIPEDIMKLVERTFLFKVEIRNGVSTRFEQSYRVKKLCLDEAIIQKFVSKWRPLEDGVRQGSSSENVAQDLMTKFTDVVADGQPDFPASPTIGLPNDSVSFIEIKDDVVDVDPKTTFNDQYTQKAVSLSQDSQSVTPVNHDIIQKKADLTENSDVVIPTKRGFNEPDKEAAQIVPKKTIKIEKDCSRLIFSFF